MAEREAPALTRLERTVAFGARIGFTVGAAVGSAEMVARVVPGIMHPVLYAVGGATMGVVVWRLSARLLAWADRNL
jgi:hypothetical protein